MIEKPFQGRAKISRNGNSLEVIIPVKKKWLAIFFTSAWLGLWSVGETVVGHAVFVNPGESVFLLLWLSVWTIGGMTAIVELLKLLTGQETIKADSGVLEISYQILFVTRVKRYQISDIKHLTTNLTVEDDVWGWGLRYRPRLSSSFNEGVLKFDYGLKTIKFGAGIDEAEGRLLLELFKSNLNFNEMNFQ